MFKSMDNEIDSCVPCHMVERKASAFWRTFQQSARASTVSLSCFFFLLTEPWNLASFNEGEEERFKFESPGFISGCSDVRQWEKAYSLREVAGSKVHATGKCGMDFLSRLHTFTSQSWCFQGVRHNVWI